MRVTLVTGTDTGVGKRVVVVKPAQTGVGLSAHVLRTCNLNFESVGPVSGRN
jgi:dethiobiotin synthetase